MKTNHILFSLFLLLFPLCAMAQLNVIIGNDTTFCASYIIDTGEDVYLGTNIVIQNGTPPYKYTWSCPEFEIYPDHYFYASDFLNDTTVVNPVFIEHPSNMSWIAFTLQITDANEETATDEIKVRFSSFVTLLNQNVLFQNVGDEIVLKASDASIEGGILPYCSYSWTPKENLLTPELETTQCVVTHSERYTLTIKDDAGCTVSDEVYDIRVGTVNLDENYSDKDAHPYQLGKTLFWSNPLQSVTKLEFYSLNGSKVTEIQTCEDNCSIPGNMPSIMVYKLSVAGKQYIGKYIKQ